MSKIGKLDLFGAEKCTPVPVDFAGDEIVLGFIQKLVDKSGASREMLHTIFWEERSYWFAFMIQTAFQRGQIVTFRHDPHCAWQDVDGLCYDIDGLCEIEYPETAVYTVTCETPAEFIRGFISKDDVEAEVMANIFSNGYCWYFANIMQNYYKRGSICLAAPFGHIVWMDSDGTPYDVYGVHEGECIYYIPEEYLGDTVEDFMHVPGRTKSASQEDVVRIMETYEKHTGKSGGVAVWKKMMGI